MAGSRSGAARSGDGGVLLLRALHAHDRGRRRSRATASPRAGARPRARAPPTLRVGSARASPKSRTRTRPSSPTITLDGLKSRWTSPARCAAASPSPAARNAPITSARERFFSFSHVASVGPSTNSVARNTSAPNVPTSKIASTFGCDRRASAFASRKSRSRRPSADDATGSPAVWRSFSATARSSSGSYAL